MPESPKKRTFSAEKPKKNTQPRTKSAGGYKKERPKFAQDEKPRRFNSSERSYRSNNEQDERPKRSYNRKPQFGHNEQDERPKRSYNRKPQFGHNEQDERPKRSYNRKSQFGHNEQDERPKRSYNRKPRFENNEHDERPKRSYNRNPRFGNNEQDDRPKRSYNRDNSNFRDRDRDSKPRRFASSQEEQPKRRRRDITAESPILSEIVAKRKREGRQTPQRQKVLSLAFEEQHGPVRLNKYIANAGICSRRDADVLITTGAITVNGEVVTELGIKVMPTDEVRYGDKVLQREKPVYLLLNKPKDYITTTDDDRDRPHVMQLVQNACKERIYPVGRLDRDTTGLLLFTNDGEMTKKLTHPRHLIRKMYYVELNKNLTNTDFNMVKEGVELSDGLIKPDEFDYVGDSKKELGITIHSGKNRVVRRIFESLGYEIEKLDRVVFAGLTKKDLPRGHWRFLSEAEINILKMTINKKEK